MFLMPHEFVRKTMDEKGVNDLLSKMKVGHIGTVDSDGKPHIVPISFDYVDGTVYFHGSDIGQRGRNISGNPNVAFEVLDLRPPGNLFRSKKSSVGQSWKCVVVRGKAEEVMDELEKAKVYGEAAARMHVYKIKPETITSRVSKRTK